MEDQSAPAALSSSPSSEQHSQQPQQPQQAEHGLTCLAWSDCPFELPRLVVGGYSKVAVVWTCEGNKWKQVRRNPRSCLLHAELCSTLQSSAVL